MAKRKVRITRKVPADVTGRADMINDETMNYQAGGLLGSVQGMNSELFSQMRNTNRIGTVPGNDFVMPLHKQNIEPMPVGSIINSTQVKAVEPFMKSIKNDNNGMMSFVQKLMTQMPSGGIGTFLGGKMQSGGEAGMMANEYVPVQMEKGEKVVMMHDYSVHDPKTKMSHAQQARNPKLANRETDVVKAGTFVASNDKSQKLNRDVAGNFVVRPRGPYVYDETKPTPIYEEQTLAEYFTKKDQTPADVVKNIVRKTPRTDNNDMFGRLTRDLNRETSRPAIDAVIAYSEAVNNSTPKYEDGEVIEQAKTGGIIKARGGGVMKAKGGFDWEKLIPAVPDTLQVLADVFGLSSSSKALKAAKRYTAESLKTINDVYNESSNWIDRGADMSQMGILGKFMLNRTGERNYLDLSAPYSRMDNAYDAAGLQTQAQRRNISNITMAPVEAMSRYYSMADPRMGMIAGATATAAATRNANQAYTDLADRETQLMLQGEGVLAEMDSKLAVNKMEVDEMLRRERELENAELMLGLAGQEEQRAANHVTNLGNKASLELTARDKGMSNINRASAVLANNVHNLANNLTRIWSDSVTSPDTNIDVRSIGGTYDDADLLRPGAGPPIRDGFRDGERSGGYIWDERSRTWNPDTM